MNTIGGVQGGVDDSDMNFTDDDCEAAGKNDDDDLSDEEEEEETPEGYVLNVPCFIIVGSVMLTLIPYSFL